MAWGAQIKSKPWKPAKTWGAQLKPGKGEVVKKTERGDVWTGTRRFTSRGEKR